MKFILILLEINIDKSNGCDSMRGKKKVKKGEDFYGEQGTFRILNPEDAGLQGERTGQEALYRRAAR